MYTHGRDVESQKGLPLEVMVDTTDESNSGNTYDSSDTAVDLG